MFFLTKQVNHYCYVRTSQSIWLNKILLYVRVGWLLLFLYLRWHLKELLNSISVLIEVDFSNLIINKFLLNGQIVD